MCIRDSAAIGDQQWFNNNRNKVLETRQRLHDGLEKLGFDVIPSQANFVWCTHSSQPLKPIYEHLKDNRVLVRYMDYQGWSDGLRISVGTDEQIDACLSLIEMKV